MKSRIVAICAIVAFATCGGRALAQFPDCAHTSSEAQAGVPARQHKQVLRCVNDRTDGQVEVTIHVALLDSPLPGTTTSMDPVLTLAPGEKRELGCARLPPAAANHMDLL